MHEGHRQRMYEKLKSGSVLYNHELLEMLLFNAYPRKNTNPIAHDLLNSFGTLQGVFDASVEDLVKIDGVGESVACYLKCIGEVSKNLNKTESVIATLKSYEDFRKFTVFRFSGRTEEVMEFYCMEKSGNVIKIVTYSSGETDKVKISMDKIANVITTLKPYGVIIAHNHLSGICRPSINDDKFTMEIQLLCSMNNVNLFDHCIYAGGEDVYSYFLSGKIDTIKSKFSFNALVEEQYKKDSEKRDN